MDNCPPNCQICLMDVIEETGEYVEPDDFSGASEGDR